VPVEQYEHVQDKFGVVYNMMCDYRAKYDALMQYKHAQDIAANIAAGRARKVKA
jgi:translation elongation factor EF-Ts